MQELFPHARLFFVLEGPAPTRRPGAPSPPAPDMHPTIRPRSRKAASNRRQRVPPALTHGGDRFDALAILDEVRDDLGLVLWRSARNVSLWAETPPEARAGLFSGGAAHLRKDDLARLELEPELLAPMSVIASLLARPGEVDLLRLVNACRRVSLWAEQRGALATALEFAQAAALVAPDSAALAFSVGRLARRHGEYDRAESWYTRAIVQGRESKDWKSYATAFSGMGNVYIRKGNLPAARKAQMRCLRAAHRHGLTDVEAGAYHDLFAIEVEAGAGLEADRLAEQAFRLYGPKHPFVVRLAYDVAYHWALQGYFSGAYHVARALLPHFRTVAERPVLFGLIARSAGGYGLRHEFEEAAYAAARLIAGGAAPDMAARTLLGLAHGAASLDDWDNAENWAEEALRHATARQEGRVVIETETTLDYIRAARTHPRSQVPERAPGSSLADEFVEALTFQAAVAATA
jgi:tetratricopeptide (TPR) repeat protein